MSSFIFAESCHSEMGKRSSFFLVLSSACLRRSFDCFYGASCAKVQKTDAKKPDCTPYRQSVEQGEFLVEHEAVHTRQPTVDRSLKYFTSRQILAFECTEAELLVAVAQPLNEVKAGATLIGQVTAPSLRAAIRAKKVGLSVELRI